MELASYLAGEKWSDAPACTDPTLAALARMVNDATSDQARPLLAPHVPAVIGMRDLPDTFAGDLALLCAAHALPVCAVMHQHALSVGVLRLLSHPEASASQELRSRAGAALAQVPDAERWARGLITRVGRPRRWRSPAVAVVEVSAQGLGTACVPDTDQRLRALLVEAIGLARDVAHAPVAPSLRPADWQDRVLAAG